MKNKIFTIPAKLCIPNVMYLDLADNYFPILKTDMFRVQLFPSLQYLHLEELGTHVERIEKFAFRNPSLSMISMMYNSFDFSIEDFSNEMFAGCPNLTALQLSHNFFTEVTDERFLDVLGRVTKLQALYLGSCGIQQISSKLFAPFPRLRELEMYQNKISEVPSGTFDRNLKLKKLLLSQNKITTITEDTFSQEVRNQLTWVDLSGNPFSCDCDLRWFNDVLRNNHTAFKSTYGGYICNDGHKTPVVSFHVVAQACIWNQTIHKAIIAAVSIFIIILCLVAFLFHYQWMFKLKVRYYVLTLSLPMSPISDV
jgi:Leucine-rich repeat (LRR) protein